MSASCIAHVHVSPIDNAKGLYVTLYNVTEDHAYIQSIQQSGNEAHLKNFYDQKLISKLNKAQAELKEKKAELEQLNELKSHFIASMSHEFRTPITSIIGYANILEKELSDAQSTASVDVVKRNAYFLLNLVNNILDEAKLESGGLQVNPSEIDLKDTLLLVESMFASLAKEKNLAFNVELPDQLPTINADEMRLQQILVNLLGNAVKFTKKGGVTLGIELLDKEIRIAVRDTGPGISQENQKLIFQPFHRLESEQQGAGLGLSITQKILELMNGGLELESEVDEGSCFTLVLPLVKVSEGLVDKTSFENKKIILVEDNKDMSDLVEFYLSDQNINLITVDDGAKAEGVIFSEKPDLVIMDMNLPNKNGVAITRALRSKGFADPILAFSAAGSASAKEQFLAAGCDDYLDKTGLSSQRLTKILSRYFINITKQAASSTSQLDLLKEKYCMSMPQKKLAIESAWKSCLSNNFDYAACKMLYTLTHNLAGSAGLYELDSIYNAAKQVNGCIRPDFTVNSSSDLKDAVSGLFAEM